MTATRRFFQWLLGLEDVLCAIIQFKEEIMASVAELQAKVVELQATVDAEQEQVAAAIAELNTQIVALQAIVAAGGSVEERQAVLDGIEAARADLEGTV